MYAFNFFLAMTWILAFLLYYPLKRAKWFFVNNFWATRQMHSKFRHHFSFRIYLMLEVLYTSFDIKVMKNPKYPLKTTLLPLKNYKRLSLVMVDPAIYLEICQNFQLFWHINLLQIAFLLNWGAIKNKICIYLSFTCSFIVNR